MRGSWWLCLGLAWNLSLAASAQAQETDTTQAADTVRLEPDRRARSDTTQADTVQAGTVRADTTAADSLVVRSAPVRFFVSDLGEAIGDTVPARLPEADATDLLAEVPGTFPYDFGAYGWPDGWSPYGLNPHRPVLLVNGLPFDDLVTGQPRYDLLPLAWLKPLRLQATRFGAPLAVAGEVRPYDRAEPLTELRYRTGEGGLQSIMAAHAQRRRRPLFGRPGVFRILLGYGGHAADNEYPNSRLRRGRQLLGRLRYEQRNVSFELSNLHNRRRVGANGGVVVERDIFETVFNRINPEVRHPEARRQTIRNDLAFTLRARLLPGLDDALTVTAFWAAQRFRHQEEPALEAEADRLGFRLVQRLRPGAQRLDLVLHGWTEHLDAREARAAETGTPQRQILDATGFARRQLHATVHDSLRLLGLQTHLQAGLHVRDAEVLPAGALRLERRQGFFGVFGEVVYAGQPATPLETVGLGRLVVPVAEAPEGRIVQGRLGASLRAGPLDLSAFGFVHDVQEPLDLYATEGEDVVQARVSDEPFRRAGLAGELAWRRTARRGFYLVARPSVVRFLNDAASPEHGRQAETLPTFFAQGRLGARYRLFRGDLDADVSVRGRYWTAFRSRTLHPQTGLLVVPEAADRLLGPSGTVDVVLEAGLRSAKLFLSYENALSGTNLQAGTLLVPVYPLPEQRLRVGVFWPILN